MTHCLVVKYYKSPASTVKKRGKYLSKFILKQTQIILLFCNFVTGNTTKSSLIYITWPKVFGHRTIAHELVGPPIKPWASSSCISFYLLYVYVEQYLHTITHLV